MNIPNFSPRTLFTLIMISLTVFMTYGGTVSAQKSSRTIDTTLTVQNLSQSAKSADLGRDQVFHFPIGSNQGQLGYVVPEGDGLIEGPMAFDINAQGDLAILDQVNSRV